MTVLWWNFLGSLGVAEVQLKDDSAHCWQLLI